MFCSEIINECSICYQESTDEVMLPCKHTYCRECIVEALKFRQSCPMCRRVCCNKLTGQFPSVNDNTYSQITPTNAGLPCFDYQVNLPMNSCVDFRFFEKRYVTMIDDALDGSLQFLINPQIGGCCYRVVLEACQPMNYPDSAYICTVKCVERVMIVSQSYRDIESSKHQLRYAVTKPIVDIPADQQILTKLLETISSLKQFGLEIPHCADAQPQEFSLILLSTIKISDTIFYEHYFSTNQQKRIELILSHYSAILNYLRSEQ